jgi:hypothetical protein
MVAVEVVHLEMTFHLLALQTLAAAVVALGDHRSQTQTQLVEMVEAVL